MSEIPPVIDFVAWVEENRHLLVPPVNNKQLWTRTGDFIVMVVGGPNRRTDFHVDPYEEWFYQLEGAMHVDLMTGDGPRTVEIGAGSMWLLPGNVPHSPQRPDPDSIGIVIERIREEGTLEKFQWYCPECAALVHEVELQVRDIVDDLPPVFQRFYDDEAARTCRACGALHPGKG
ncbi:3-hydroxyanthranilate 3,4-dioxygenase [Amycolatopsis sp. NPDC059021]|uniref:3-hydroxyanthranilate 3,4-dioxygenase n=1 Tax=Amycolatopsis sp. NPDC059021 TaxID=3346704 RepID=UPI00366D080E